MILLKKITLDNFLSHEHTEIAFNESEKALIDGASGAGKSSIFDSIIWALYGEGRADNKSLVRKGAKKATVTLELNDFDPDERRTNNTYIITREASTGGRHTLGVIVEDSGGDRKALPLSGVREIQAWIDKELIGASHLLFVNSVAYVQGNSDSFVSQTATKRKELLLEIVKADDYDKYYENAKQKLASLDSEKATISGQVMELEMRSSSLRASISDGKEKHLQAILEHSQAIKETEPKIKTLEQESASLRAHAQTVNVLNELIKNLSKEIESTETLIQSKKSKLERKETLLSVCKQLPVLNEQYSTVEDSLNKKRKSLEEAGSIETIRNAHFAKKPVVRDRSQEMKRHEDMITLLEKKESCPSGDKCPYHSKNLESIKEHENEIVKLAEETVAEARALASWEAETATLPPAIDITTIIGGITVLEANKRELEANKRAAEAAEREISEMEVIEKEIPLLEQSVHEKKQQQEETLKKKEEAEKLAKFSDINTIDNDLLRMRNDIITHNSEIVRSTTIIDAIDKTELELKEITEKVKNLKDTDLKRIESQAMKVGLIKAAFGSKGIETMVIDYLLPKLEDRINEVLGKLSDFRVRLDTQRKGSDGESIVEGLFITILNELNEEMPFEAYSGGEKLKISVAISESLATLQKVGFRLFDETFIGLDENSTESFADVLSGLQSNFNQVFCISHLLQIKELFEKKHTVLKKNSISTVI